MQNIKCADCAEYRNEWCEKIIDSPYPDIERDCQYFHAVGKWIWGNPNEPCRCSNCGKAVDQRYPYCPWCGTRMGEVEE